MPISGLNRPLFTELETYFGQTYFYPPNISGNWTPVQLVPGYTAPISPEALFPYYLLSLFVFGRHNKIESVCIFTVTNIVNETKYLYTYLSACLCIYGAIVVTLVQLSLVINRSFYGLWMYCIPMYLYSVSRKISSPINLWNSIS